AILAAAHTVPEERPVHSMHGYFLRTGDVDGELIYRVRELRDGRSFSSRQVEAYQGTRLLFTMTASFHAPEPGIEHALPAVTGFPDPETIEHFSYEGERRLAHRMLLDTRRVPPSLDPGAAAGRQAMWFRTWEPVSAPTASANRAALSVATDIALLEPVVLRHGATFAYPGLRAASLDHAMWFFDEAPFDEWMLFLQETTWAGHGRGVARGTIHRRDGSLVAIVQQEGILRFPVEDLARLPDLGADTGA
ncbi:MAG TPA: acyl-CoA thioesterase domain-containing protein, partial [Gryllotalpicola sp.]